MADPFSLSTEYQKRLDSSTFALDNAPKYFMEGLKIPGMISQNRTLGIEAQNAQEQLSSTQQLKEMMEDPRGIANSFGELKTADEMRKHMAKYSAIAITPMGQRIMGTWDKLTSLKEASEEHSIERVSELAYAKKDVEFRMKHGLPKNASQEQIAAATADDNIDEFLNEAEKFGKDGSSVDINPSDFDANGNWIPGSKIRLLRTAPVSNKISSRETIESNKLQNRIDLLEYRMLVGTPLTAGGLEKDIEYIQRKVRDGTFTKEQGEHMIAMRGGLEAKASAALIKANDWMVQLDYKALLARQKTSQNELNLLRASADHPDKQANINIQLKIQRQIQEELNSRDAKTTGSSSSVPPTERQKVYFRSTRTGDTGWAYVGDPDLENDDLEFFSTPQR